jgi:flavoprotein
MRIREKIWSTKSMKITKTLSSNIEEVVLMFKRFGRLEDKSPDRAQARLVLRNQMKSRSKKYLFYKRKSFKGQ